MSKEKLEAAVAKLTKALNDFTKVFETHGSHITDEQQQKAFAWLSGAAGAAMQKAALNRQMNGFSLDSDLPAVTVPAIPLPAPVQATAAVPGLAPGERLAGQLKKVEEDDGIVFLDDEDE
jgi:hypothetical protein